MTPDPDKIRALAEAMIDEFYRHGGCSDDVRRESIVLSEQLLTAVWPKVFPPEQPVDTRRTATSDKIAEFFYKRLGWTEDYSRELAAQLAAHIGEPEQPVEGSVKVKIYVGGEPLADDMSGVLTADKFTIRTCAVDGVDDDMDASNEAFSPGDTHHGIVTCVLLPIPTVPGTVEPKGGEA